MFVALFYQKGNVTLELSCVVDVHVSLFWDTIEWGQMTFRSKRHFDIPSVRGTGDTIITKIAQQLPGDHHSLIGGLIYALNYAPGVGADLPVPLYLNKNYFQKVTVEVPAFEIEVGFSFGLAISDDLNFEKRYIIGSRAVSWELQEKLDPVTSASSEKPILSVYAEASCSATDIVSCSHEGNSTTEDFSGATFDQVAFFKPILAWISDLSASGKDASIYFRQTPESDIFFNSLVGHNHKLGFEHLLPAKEKEEEGYGSIADTGDAPRKLLVIEEQCLRMGLDDDFSALACMSINDESWMTAEVNFIEDRTNNAVLLLPYVKEHLYLSTAFDSSREQLNDMRDETYGIFRAPLVLRVDDFISIDGFARLCVLSNDFSKDGQDVTLFDVAVENKGKTLVNGSITAAFAYNSSAPDSSSVQTSAALDVYGMNGKRRWKIRPALDLLWTGDGVSMNRFHGPIIASWKGSRAANFTAAGTLLVVDSTNALRVDGSGNMLLGYDGQDEAGKYVVGAYVSEQFRSNGHLLTFNGRGDVEVSSGNFFITGRMPTFCQGYP